MPDQEKPTDSGGKPLAAGDSVLIPATVLSVGDRATDVNVVVAIPAAPGFADAASEIALNSKQLGLAPAALQPAAKAAPAPAPVTPS